MSSQEEHVLLVDLFRDGQWEEVMDRMRSEEGREELRRKDEYGHLPLHRACQYGAPLELIETMLGEYHEADRVTSDDGDLPLHYACSPVPGVDISPQVVRLLLDSYPEGAKAHNNYSGYLPLQQAASRNAPLEVLEMLLDTHPEGAASRDHLLLEEASPYALNLLERLRNESVTAQSFSSIGQSQGCQSAKDVLIRSSIRPLKDSLLDMLPASRIFSSNPAQFSSSPAEMGFVDLISLEAQERNLIAEQIQHPDQIDQSKGRQSAKVVPIAPARNSVLEFNQKSDLLFSFNPDILPHRKDSGRLQRFVDLISREAQGRSLGGPAHRVWVWMCTFANTDDPNDNYVPQINAILESLGDRNTVEWLASIETPGVRQIREIAAPTCAKAINAHFLFAGRLELDRDRPMHKSATCIVVDAKDFGDPTDSIGFLDKESKLNKYHRVVVKFMSDAKQFDREVRTRNLSNSTRCSDQSKSPFLVPGITYFDTREFSPIDAHYKRDIHERKDVFGHNLMHYPFALVMKRGDRNFDVIYRHEEPRMLRVRMYMEEIAMQLQKFHSNGRIHADIKPLNIVRLDDVLTLIDVDASRQIGSEKVGTKYSSGVLPPEMIYQLQSETEEQQFVAYWKDEVKAFNVIQRIIHESDEGMPDEISELLEEERGSQTGHVDTTLEFLCDQSSTLYNIFEKAGRNIDAFYDIWTGLTKEAALWAKLRPRICKNGRKYVVKAFRHGDEFGLPYKLVQANVSFDMWSFGILLYKVCTKKSLFAGNDVTDDLYSGDSYAELANWDLETNACIEKLNDVTNNSASYLLRLLLCRDAGERPKSMTEVLGHDFFETDFHAKRKVLHEELRRLQLEAQKLDRARKDTSYERAKRIGLEKRLQKKNEQIVHVKDELKEMVNALSASDLIRCRKWGAVRKKINQSDQKDIKDLFFEACRHGPRFEVVRDFLRLDEKLLTETRNEELPVHVVCCFGAETKVIELLIHQHPKSLMKKSGLDHMTPLQIAEASQWKFNQESYVEVIELLRRGTFPNHFDSKTQLPNKEAFDEWAHIPPPGVENRNAYAILLFLDIAGFKAVNDMASYADGDRAIKTYSTAVSKLCRKFVRSADADLQLTIECFRMGGDEFTVVAKFAGDDFTSPVMDVWDKSLEQLVREIACLEVKDSNCPSRYSTFFGIGCCAGRASDIKELLEKAEELQKQVKEEIGVKRGDSISLGAVCSNIRNFSELVEL